MRATRIAVKADRLVCDIQLSSDCSRMSSPSFIALLLRCHPCLPYHACKNGQGATFASVMERTSLIHVLEHVAIDCMVQGDSCSNTLFRGNSQWLDRNRGTGRVELSFRDDIAALYAVKEALDHMNKALETMSAGAAGTAT